MGTPRTWNLAERRRRTRRLSTLEFGFIRMVRRRTWKAASPAKRRFIVRMIHSLSLRRLWDLLMKRTV